MGSPCRNRSGEGPRRCCRQPVLPHHPPPRVAAGNHPFPIFLLLSPSSSSRGCSQRLFFPFPLFVPGLQPVFSEHLSPQPLGPQPHESFSRSWRQGRGGLVHCKLSREGEGGICCAGPLHRVPLQAEGWESGAVKRPRGCSPTIKGRAAAQAGRPRSSARSRFGMFYYFLPSEVLKLESLFLIPNKVIKVKGR